MKVYVVNGDIGINLSNIVRASKVFKELLNNVGVEEFTDPRYYPSAGVEPELVLRYFLFMVSIDHRTSYYTAFEGAIRGAFFHGADLLYRLGMLKFSEDPEFFSPNRMARIGVEEVRSWLSVSRTDGSTVTIWDPEVRALLLRNIALKLIKLYKGSVTTLINISGGYLKKPIGYGLIDLLKAFKAYSDPVEKKAYLFVKFISRRGLFRYVDREHSEVPVDNHLTRVALRLGLVELPSTLRAKLIRSEEFSWVEDVALRLAVRRAFKVVATLMGTDPLILDDLLWLFGRHCCTREDLVCRSGCKGRCRELNLCSNGCPLESVCPQATNSTLLTEHKYTNTFYY
ncbi:MAG: hypothetical protein B6U73_03060 [Desulfurococcales archaeon ex4484_204]|nr:MAG: hypothetical protein B6U73_03060 [Desulfurococcales archaeon ex4484_204]